MIDLDLLRHFAQGGEAPQGQPAIVGENGPELIVPQNDTTVIPNDQAGGIIELLQMLQKNMMQSKQAPTAPSATSPTMQAPTDLMLPRPSAATLPKIQDRVSVEEPPLMGDPTGLARYLEFHEKKRQAENRNLYDKSYDVNKNLIAKEWVRSRAPGGGFDYSPDIKDDVMLYHGLHHVAPGNSGRGDAAVANAAAILKGMADSKPAPKTPFSDERTLINNEVNRRQQSRDDKNDRQKFLQDFYKSGVQNPNWGIYGNGGVAPAGQPAIVGDQGPELILPGNNQQMAMNAPEQSMLPLAAMLPPSHFSVAKAQEDEMMRERYWDLRKAMDIRNPLPELMTPKRIKNNPPFVTFHKDGGTAAAGQPAVVGEAGPELIVPQNSLSKLLDTIMGATPKDYPVFEQGQSVGGALSNIPGNIIGHTKEVYHEAEPIFAGGIEKLRHGNALPQIPPAEILDPSKWDAGGILQSLYGAYMGINSPVFGVGRTGREAATQLTGDKTFGEKTYWIPPALTLQALAGLGRTTAKTAVPMLDEATAGKPVLANPQMLALEQAPAGQLMRSPHPPANRQVINWAAEDEKQLGKAKSDLPLSSSFDRQWIDQWLAKNPESKSPEYWIQPRKSSNDMFKDVPNFNHFRVHDKLGEVGYIDSSRRGPGHVYVHNTFGSGGRPLKEDSLGFSNNRELQRQVRNFYQEKYGEKIDTITQVRTTGARTGKKSREQTFKWNPAIAGFALLPEEEKTDGSD